ncbi:polysaccharide biosynthesis/export family protein [Hymenobacter yonginensis]|uniref:Polysaccharide export protein n=1 Tax=Hymenobacter yonginensis TaxID=748197 RepID=A0ABY7PRA7_9BACT|nr:polysaccharide biosynthesis/export family protein [Hymenobacter yonginensis]WBO85380.1 polysaccharide export protein [Hymenobacter yonginensis]
MSTTLVSCVSTRDVSYLQGNYSAQPTSVVNQPAEYLIMPNDVLYIKVQSAQPELTKAFNLHENELVFNQSDPGSLYVNGYVVDNTGNILVPTVGKVPVKGLTISAAQELVQKSIATYVRNATVVLRLVSFRVTVLGEVKTPGRYTIFNDRATVLEALGLAGDLTPLGNRRNVKLIRQTKDGSQVMLLDLTRPELLSSPYYYLLPNDALYVEPVKALTQRGNSVNLGLLFSGLGTAALLYGLFR